MNRFTIRPLLVLSAAMVTVLSFGATGASAAAVRMAAKGHAPEATCSQLTKAQIQPLIGVRITKVKVTKVKVTALTGHQCVFSGSGGNGQAIGVIVLKGGEAESAFNSEVAVLAGKVAVKGVGDKAYRAKSDFQPVAISGNDYCSVSVGSSDTIPGVGSIEEANGGRSTLPESDNSVIAAALGTICNRVYGKGNTTVSLAALRSTTQTSTTQRSSAGGSSAAAPPGTTQSTKTASEDPLKVTLVKVTDPATQTDPNNGPYAGMRWVGLQFTVVVNGPDEDTGTSFIIGSDGMTYGFNTSQSIGGYSTCTATTDTLRQGRPATICTGVMLPTSVQVTKVAFSGLATEKGTGVVYWSPS